MSESGVSHVTRAFNARQRGFTIIEIATVLIIIGLLVALLLPNMWYARASGRLVACSQNLKNIAIGLQTYANDNDQCYPRTLASLTPRYLETLPSCPAAKGTDSYSGSYTAATAPLPNFTIFCSGAYHVGIEGISPDQPAYSLQLGLQP